MYCALSGTVPEQPVVSKLSGHVFEKRLLDKWLDANSNTCPVTKQTLTPDDIVEIKVTGPKVVAPRPTTASSIPGMLSLFQNEWDALMLETYTLKQQLESVRQELAHSLYQHDAACRVIARLLKERDEAKNALSNFRATTQSEQRSEPSHKEAAESMEVESSVSLPEEIKAAVQAKSQELAKDRKKRQPAATLATAEEIKSYDAITTVPLHTASGSRGISSVDINPSSQNVILTGGVDGSLILFDSKEKKILATLSDHSKKVTDVAFHPTEDVLFSCSADKTAKMWGLSGKTYQVASVKKHQAEVVGCAVQAVGDYWVTASADRTWAFHDIPNDKTVMSVSADTALTCVQFHPDGLLLGTGTVESTVKVWDIKSAKNVATFEGHKGKLVDLAFSENGYYLATVAEDNIIKLWDLRKLKNIQSQSVPEDFAASSVEFDYSGTYLAVSGKEVRVFLGKSLGHIATFGKHTGQVTEVKWGADAKFLASVSMDRNLKIWAPK